MRISKNIYDDIKIVCNEEEVAELTKFLGYGIDHCNEYGVKVSESMKEIHCMLKSVSEIWKK